MNLNALTQVADLCAAKGIHHAILCPGSRNAPLIIAFARNKFFQCKSFSDERSAAFIALGIAQQTNSPVVLVCTSGSAGFNFAPAVAEAFFQHVPLIIITADRPAEWVDQLDGQTIRQQNLYGSHVKKFFELPMNDPHQDASWHANRLLNEAINLAVSGQKGPVHINVPFREPLYPTKGEVSSAPAPKLINVESRLETLSSEQLLNLKQQLKKFKKILIVSGQQEKNKELNQALINFNEVYQLAIAGDVLSNLHSLSFVCRHTDTFLGQLTDQQKEDLRPDLLISFGRSLVSKNLKLFLRQFKPAEHWHIQMAGETADTFQALTKIIPLHPVNFFHQLYSLSDISIPTDPTFQNNWLSYDRKTKKTVDSFFTGSSAGEFELVHRVLRSLPSPCCLHLANSMSVRYANHIGVTDDGISVFSNRGTSGIDGCTSTAVGHALSSAIPNVLITGDLAFFYDRNAFWHNYVLPNLYVIVLNNHGGIIFNLIDGPSDLPEAEEFFITRQQLTAKALAREYDFSHTDASNFVPADFFKGDGKVKILEVDSVQSRNKEIFQAFKKAIKKSYES